jgi:4'-phosphopantetheinyl transferase
LPHLSTVFIPSGLFDLPRQGQIHLWSATVLSQQTDIRQDGNPDPKDCPFFSLLSKDERERADQYRVQIARQQFVVTRALLRTLLGQYLQKDPKKIDFCYSAHGKPELLMPSTNLCFNVSHSKGVALFAVCQNQPIGVDLEWINPAVNGAAIARRMFSAQEQAAIACLPLLEQQTKFFQLWTRKEALIKLLGDRLFSGLKDYEVSAEGSADGCWVNLGQQSVWLQDLCFTESFAAAIAIPTPPAQVQHRWWHWSSTASKT